MATAFQCCWECAETKRTIGPLLVIGRWNLKNVFENTLSDEADGLDGKLNGK